MATILTNILLYIKNIVKSYQSCFAMCHSVFKCCHWSFFMYKHIKIDQKQIIQNQFMYHAVKTLIIIVRLWRITSVCCNWSRHEHVLIVGNKQSVSNTHISPIKLNKPSKNNKGGTLILQFLFHPHFFLICCSLLWSHCHLLYSINQC